MTICDAYCAVVCDAKECREEIQVFYGAGRSDSQIAAELLREEWVVLDGRHFCSPECARAERKRP